MPSALTSESLWPWPVEVCPASPPRGLGTGAQEKYQKKKYSLLIISMSGYWDYVVDSIMVMSFVTMTVT